MARTPADPDGTSPDDTLAQHPEYAEVHLLEEDETVPPRPEEEIADAGD
ncbi:hypothetical protein [Paraoerskovia sediminicola]|nr:hypothetical protein [Paraoerskovia sediminicola]